MEWVQQRCGNLRVNTLRALRFHVPGRGEPTLYNYGLILLSSHPPPQ